MRASSSIQLNSVEERTGFLVGDVEGEVGVGGVAAVVKDHGGPVFARVRLLLHPGELDLDRGGVVVLHAHHRVAFVHLVEELGDVPEPHEVVVREERPSLVVVEVGHEEATVGELRALLRVLLAAVQTLLAQLLALQGLDVHGHGRVLLDAVFRHLVRDVLVAIVAEVHAERMVARGQLVTHPRAVRGGVLLHRGSSSRASRDALRGSRKRCYEKIPTRGARKNREDPETFSLSWIAAPFRPCVLPSGCSRATRRALAVRIIPGLVEERSTGFSTPLESPYLPSPPPRRALRPGPAARTRTATRRLTRPAPTPAPSPPTPSTALRPREPSAFAARAPLRGRERPSTARTAPNPRRSPRARTPRRRRRAREFGGDPERLLSDSV